MEKKQQKGSERVPVFRTYSKPFRTFTAYFEQNTRSVHVPSPLIHEIWLKQVESSFLPILHTLLHVDDTFRDSLGAVLGVFFHETHLVFERDPSQFKTRWPPGLRETGPTPRALWWQVSCSSVAVDGAIVLGVFQSLRTRT